MTTTPFTVRRLRLAENAEDGADDGTVAGDTAADKCTVAATTAHPACAAAADDTG